MQAKAKSFPIDNSALLYLSVLAPHHSNTYRFTVMLTEPVCPETLQKAADRVCPRFPTIIAGFRPDFFSYSVVPAAKAPAVEADPGLLHTMSRREIEKCAYRIYYSGCEISIEAFHALTDGYGAIRSFRAMIAEYLYLRYGVQSEERIEALESGEPDWQEELHDAYLDHSEVDPKAVSRRYAYQLPHKAVDWQVRNVSEEYDIRDVLAAAKRHGVSLTAFLSCLMAEAIMEVQKREKGSRRLPVRIMVPVDLRRLFPCRTMRNFILYALPTLEPENAELPRETRMALFNHQLKEQTTSSYLMPQVSKNVRMQRSPIFRMIPRSLKCMITHTAYRFLGECNSSITLTNLGSVAFSEEMRQYVRGIDVLLTPRRKSPYNCSVISCGTSIRINITRFAALPEMESIFFEKLRSTIQA